MSVICTDTCCQPERESDETLIVTRYVQHTRKTYSCIYCFQQITAGSACDVLVIRDNADGTVTDVRAHPGNGACAF